jgi:hypothetical protein
MMKGDAEGTNPPSFKLARTSGVARSSQEGVGASAGATAGPSDAETLGLGALELAVGDVLANGAVLIGRAIGVTSGLQATSM